VLPAQASHRQQEEELAMRVAEKAMTVNQVAEKRGTLPTKPPRELVIAAAEAKRRQQAEMRVVVETKAVAVDRKLPHDHNRNIQY
jgi:hypothetical protein